MSFEQTLSQRVSELRKRDASLDEIEATAQVLNRDPALYAAYRKAKWALPAAEPEPRAVAASSPAEQEALRRAEGLVSKSSGALGMRDALAQVFAADAELYSRYRVGKQTDFGAELLSRQLDLYDHCAALQSTIADILDGDGDDKGAQITTALDDFRAAVLAQVREAGLEVVEKRAPQHPLAGDLLALATALNPEDPLGRGMVRCRQALAELTEVVRAKKRSAA
jgi:hypothetical protein